MKSKKVFLLSAALVLCAGILHAEEEMKTTANQIINAPPPEMVKMVAPLTVTGEADVKGTTEGSKVSGTVTFLQQGENVLVQAKFSNLPPGKHGFHIHEKGSCEDQGKAAGGHFNPMGTPHGFLPQDGMEKAHSGDLGNTLADEKGDAAIMMLLPGVTLQGGMHDVAGLAVIVHEKEDDFGQPTGNAGGRIGCGIISVNK